MRDVSYRESQIAHQMDPHIRPINEFVERLKDPEQGLWMPMVAPLHGGVDAQILSVLRDPGPKTQEGSGSGFLCIENDDPTAETQCNLFEEYGISARQVLPWNAYPWYINRAPNAAEKNAGAEVIQELISLIPTLKVVLLQGNDAVDVWARVIKRNPTLVTDRNLVVVESIHPGKQALRTTDEAVREQRKQKQRDALKKVVESL